MRPGQHVQEVLHDQDPPGQLGQAGGAVQLAADGQHEEGRQRFAVGRLSHAQGTCISQIWPKVGPVEILRLTIAV